MHTRRVGNSCAGAVAFATLITVVSAWTLVHATASIERDPFHFAATMIENGNLSAPQSVTVRGGSVGEGFEHGRPDLLAPAPLCPGTCA